MFLAVGVSFVGGFPGSSSRRFPGVHSLYLLFFMVVCREEKLFKRAGVYSMIFKVLALREEIGDPLDICIVLTVIFHPPSHFLEWVERR